jgi:5-methylcytosine-specific restriction endonuclease McrA
MPRYIYDWDEIQRCYDAGHGFVECRRRFGFTHGAWNKAIRSGRLRAFETAFRDRRRRYDWAEIQRYYDEGHSYRECRIRFGFCAASWEKARQRKEIRSRPFGKELAMLLVPNGGSRHHVKRRLLEAGLMENRCSACSITEWQGAPLMMHIDHINGIRNDHRLENLRMLCPNCHSQTETYGARNRKRRRRLQDSGRVV